MKSQKDLGVSITNVDYSYQKSFCQSICGKKQKKPYKNTKIGCDYPQTSLNGNTWETIKCLNFTLGCYTLYLMCMSE